MTSFLSTSKRIFARGSKFGSNGVLCYCSTGTLLQVVVQGSSNRTVGEMPILCLSSTLFVFYAVGRKKNSFTRTRAKKISLLNKILSQERIFCVPTWWKEGEQVIWKTFQWLVVAVPPFLAVVLLDPQVEKEGGGGGGRGGSRGLYCPVTGRSLILAKTHLLLLIAYITFLCPPTHPLPPMSSTSQIEYLPSLSLFLPHQIAHTHTRMIAFAPKLKSPSSFLKSEGKSGTTVSSSPPLPSSSSSAHRNAW